MPARLAVDAADAPAVASEIVAPVTWRMVDFLSDLHLADDTPHSFDAWASYMQSTPADAVFIIGDLFEAWPGDDARVDGFEARCAEVLRSASTHRVVAFMAGNRDFLVGAELLDATGVRALDDPTVLQAFGQRTLISHGDAWCLADAPYQRFRAQVRNPDWKRAVLAQSLPERRALASQLRRESEQQASVRPASEWADVDAALALRWLQANRADTLVHGHTHRPGTESIGGSGSLRHVLSDWHLDAGGAGRADVLRWQADGFTRLSPQAAGRPHSRA